MTSRLMKRFTLRGPIPVEVDLVRYHSFKEWCASPECTVKSLKTNKMERQRYRNELREVGWVRVGGTLVLATPK